MKLHIPIDLMNRIRAHGEAAYPEEGAGFLLGRVEGERRFLMSILPVTQWREEAARGNRYLLLPREVLRAEESAQRLGLDLVGIFHSHPDHPAQASEFDREWAMPWFSYLITSVQDGKAGETRSWRLSDDRAGFVEEEIRMETEITESRSR